MYARVVLGATKSVPFREVSSIQGCPYRGVPLYTYNITGKEVCSECDDPGWCDTASDCSECDAGSFSGVGSSNCTLCDKGTFAK